MLAFCVLFAVALVGAEAQTHGHAPLHSICHSNHQQLVEDQVIEMVVQQMDVNSDGNVIEQELLVFFADLMGINFELLGVSMDMLMALNNTVLLQMAHNLDITKHDFVQAWHTRYHDSVEFVGATFDALDSFDGTVTGHLHADDIEAILDHAMVTFDADGDDVLQRAELVAYLEHIYKNC